MVEFWLLLHQQQRLPKLSRTLPSRSLTSSYSHSHWLWLAPAGDSRSGLKSASPSLYKQPKHFHSCPSCSPFWKGYFTVQERKRKYLSYRLRHRDRLRNDWVHPWALSENHLPTSKNLEKSRSLWSKTVTQALTWHPSPSEWHQEGWRLPSTLMWSAEWLCSQQYVLGNLVHYFALVPKPSIPSN